MEKETKNDKLLERLTLSQKVDYTLLEGKLGIFCFVRRTDEYIQAIREHLEGGILPREMIFARVYRDIMYNMTEGNKFFQDSPTLIAYSVEEVYQAFKKELDEYEKSMK
ncbi:hypothetical protein J4221_01045 [Candidatus Pacearchaeota archaeon]|nr:hypothetical protein [Candidatus Pacearchaeota archaeon]